MIVQLAECEEERRATARAAAAAQATAGSREMILGAALRAFAAQGFDGSSTREIAARAGGRAARCASMPRRSTSSTFSPERPA
jgi:hypothetical protein